MHTLAPSCSHRLRRLFGCDSLHIILAHLSRWSEVIRRGASRYGTLAHAEGNMFDGRIAKRPPFAAHMEFPS
jgi:hypothetical protein